MHQTKVKVIIVMIIMIVFMAVGYALLSTNLNINGSTAVTSNWQVEFSDIRTVSLKGGATNKVTPTVSKTTANFEVDLVQPGDEITYEIDITNYGDIEAEVKGATYTSTGSDAIYIRFEGIRKGTRISSCEGQSTCPKVTVIVKVGYDASITSDPEEKTKDISITLDIGQYVSSNPTPDGELIPELNIYTLPEKILNDNKIQSDTNIDFSKTSEQDGTKGLYYTNKNTERGQTVYYFRGAVENNYVSFAGYYWRIIRINEDGSVRLIYQGESIDATGSEATIGISAFNTNYNDNAYVGYMYGYPETTTLYGDVYKDNVVNMKDVIQLNQILEGNVEPTEEQMVLGDMNLDGKLDENDVNILTEILANYNYDTGESSYTIDDYATDEARYNATHKNVHDSTIKTILDTWYQQNLLNYENHIADAGFCGDRSIASESGLWYSSDTALGYSTNRTQYGVYNRLYNNKNPQFKCSRTHDLYTTSDNNRGNQALDYPIGLITADEIAYAGGVLGNSNTNYYLNINYDYYNISTTAFMESHAVISRIRQDARFSDGYSNSSWGVRPAIVLKPNVEIISGNGTQSNPYVIPE